MKEVTTYSFFDIGDVVTHSTDFLCEQCRLYQTCKSPRMPLTGGGRTKTLLIAEAPGEDEDLENRQLVGEVGKWFSKKLKQRGLDLEKDFWKTNAVRCRPPNNREPSRNELISCRPDIEKQIRELKPRFVWLLGGAAIESYFMDRFSDLKPSRWRGLCIPDFVNGVWVIPIFHPSFAYRNEDDPLILSQYERDLDFAIECVRTKGKLENFAVPDLNSVRILKDFDEVCDLLEDLVEKPTEILYFDYETTGLKPYKEGHKIATLSLITEEDDFSYSFPMRYPHWTELQARRIEDKWKKVLRTQSKKVAHNIKFEDVWSRVILNTMPRNWHWDTMLTAHILDNRKKFISLKFQAFVRWGVVPYDKEIKPYLRDLDERGFNKILKAPLNKLLLYGAIDALLTKWLYKAQELEIDEHLSQGRDLFTEGTLALADIEINGINADVDYYRNAHRELEARIEKRQRELLEFEECKKFEEVVGRPPNLGSSDDLRKMFFDILKFQPLKKTDRGNVSVDKDVLAKIDSPLAKEITELSRIKKIDNTYITQFLREIEPDHRIHPFFDLGNVVTYRGSSSNPNFQNVPVRNEEAKRYARSGIIPSKGFQILDFDYKAIEVCMGGCYTKDPVLVKYITDKDSDMHRDTASDIFLLHDAPMSYWKDKTSGNKVRFFTKNGYVFPEWYGSYYKNCAINLWTECSHLKSPDNITIAEHLMEKGVIRNKKKALEEFIEHVKEKEKAYWRKFKIFKRWQEEWYKSYEKRGFVELLTGFKCSGYLGRNELVNYPFQGTAFHCLLWSIIEINAQLRERKMKSKIIAQIHDNAIIDCCPDEHDDLKELCTLIATKHIREYWDWIIVPLEIEWEHTQIDENWYAKTDIKEED